MCGQDEADQDSQAPAGLSKGNLSVSRTASPNRRAVPTRRCPTRDFLANCGFEPVTRGGDPRDYTRTMSKLSVGSDSAGLEYPKVTSGLLQRAFRLTASLGAVAAITLAGYRVIPVN